MRVEDRVYRPGDLPRARVPGTLLGVVGHPVAHSKSPPMHRAALDALPGFEHWDYIRIEATPESLGDLFAEARAKGFCGLNLTVPHKEVALSLLDTCEPVAARAGSANTIAFDDQSIHGTTTDGIGLLAALAEDLGFVPGGKRILFLGAGGAARGGADALLEAGAGFVQIANRTLARAETLCANLRANHPGAPVAASGADPADLRPSDFDLVINASSAGLDPGAPSPLRFVSSHGTPAVYDMIYNPPETALLRAAAAQNLPCANGLGMLVHQGLASLRWWTGAQPDPAIMRAAVSSQAQVREQST